MTLGALVHVGLDRRLAARAAGDARSRRRRRATFAKSCAARSSARKSTSTFRRSRTGGTSARFARSWRRAVRPSACASAPTARSPRSRRRRVRFTACRRRRCICTRSAPSTRFSMSSASIWGLEQLGVERVYCRADRAGRRHGEGRARRAAGAGAGDAQAARGTSRSSRARGFGRARDADRRRACTRSVIGAAAVGVRSASRADSAPGRRTSSDARTRCASCSPTSTDAATARRRGSRGAVCDIDDMSPEYLAAVADRVRDAGALDVTLLAATMKRGRPGTRVEVLCRPADAARIEELLLIETTTIGVRRASRAAAGAPRELVQLTLLGHEIRCEARHTAERPAPSEAGIRRCAARRTGDRTTSAGYFSDWPPRRRNGIRTASVATDGPMGSVALEQTLRRERCSFGGEPRFLRSWRRRFAATAGAQQKACEIDEGTPNQVARAMLDLQIAQSSGKPEDAANKLKDAIKLLSEGDKTKNPVGRSMVLGRTLVLWMGQPSMSSGVATRGALGFATEPTASVRHRRRHRLRVHRRRERRIRTASRRPRRGASRRRGSISSTTPWSWATRRQERFRGRSSRSARCMLYKNAPYALHGAREGRRRRRISRRKRSATTSRRSRWRRTRRSPTRVAACCSSSARTPRTCRRSRPAPTRPATSPRRRPRTKRSRRIREPSTPTPRATDRRASPRCPATRRRSRRRTPTSSRIPARSRTTRS